MKPTPITQFRTITTARVMPPQAPAKPPAYAARLAQHIAMGRTPAQAMVLIERSEQPWAGRLPTSTPIDMGGKGKFRQRITSADLVLPHITRDWQIITPEIVAKIGLHHEAVRQALKRLSQAGQIECKRNNGSSPTLWRLA